MCRLDQVLSDASAWVEVFGLALVGRIALTLDAYLDHHDPWRRARAQRIHDAVMGEVRDLANAPTQGNRIVGEPPYWQGAVPTRYGWYRWRRAQKSENWQLVLYTHEACTGDDEWWLAIDDAKSFMSTTEWQQYVGAGPVEYVKLDVPGDHLCGDRGWCRRCYPPSDEQ